MESCLIYVICIYLRIVTSFQIMFISLKNSTTGARTGTETAYNSGAFVLTPVLVGVMVFLVVFCRLLFVFYHFLLVITLVMGVRSLVP